MEKTITNSPKTREPRFWEVMDSFVLVVYASLADSKTLLQQLLACLKFNLDSEDLLCWYKWKKWVLWAIEGAQAAENHHGDEWGLTWYLWWRIKFTSSSRSPKFKDILPWNTSQMITKTIPISKRKVISYAMKQDMTLQCNETETTAWSEFSNGGKTIVEQILWNEMKWNIFFWITFT